MNHIGEWLNNRIRRLIHKLEYEMFTHRDLRVRREAELSALLEQRDRLNEFRKRMAKEERAALKDPTWGGLYPKAVEPDE